MQGSSVRKQTTAARLKKSQRPGRVSCALEVWFRGASAFHKSGRGEGGGKDYRFANFENGTYVSPTDFPSDAIGLIRHSITRNDLIADASNDFSRRDCPTFFSGIWG